MDNNIKYLIAAFTGWLLVQISATAGETLYVVINNFVPSSEGLARSFSLLIASIGWISTVVFSIPILKNAWSSLFKKTPTISEKALILLIIGLTITASIIIAVVNMQNR